MKLRIVRRQFLMVTAAALGVGRSQNAFSQPLFPLSPQGNRPSEPLGQSPKPPEPPGQAKKGLDPVSLPDYDKNPFRHSVGTPLTPHEMVTRPLPGEVSGPGLLEVAP